MCQYQVTVVVPEDKDGHDNNHDDLDDDDDQDYEEYDDDNQYEDDGDGVDTYGDNDDLDDDDDILQGLGLSCGGPALARGVNKEEKEQILDTHNK